MAGYFSNHSNQSRFLASSTSSQSATTTTQAPTPSNSNPTGPPRSRLPSSKHFSTSLLTSNEEHPKPQEKYSSKSPSSTNGAEVHPLRNTYVRNLLRRVKDIRVLTNAISLFNRWIFWFRQQRAPGNKIISYEEGIKKISACSSVSLPTCLWTSTFAHEDVL